jgi:hypothetical protein
VPVTHDLGRQPVRRVVLAEPVPLLAIDQGFIENLQNVAFDLIEAEAAHMRQNAADEGLTLRLGHHPIEEIALSCAEDARRLEGCAGQHVPGIVVTKAKDRQGDGLGDDHKERVLKE